MICCLILLLHPVNLLCFLIAFGFGCTLVGFLVNGDSVDVSSETVLPEVVY